MLLKARQNIVCILRIIMTVMNFLSYQHSIFHEHWLSMVFGNNIFSNVPLVVFVIDQVNLGIFSLWRPSICLSDCNFNIGTNISFKQNTKLYFFLFELIH